MGGQAIHNQLSALILAHNADSLQREAGIQLCQVHNHVAYRAAGGADDRLSNRGKLPTLRITRDGIDDILYQVASHANALRHNDSPLFRDF